MRIGRDDRVERLVITEVGMSAGNERTRSVPGFIMDRLKKEKKKKKTTKRKKRPPFVCAE